MDIVKGQPIKLPDGSVLLPEADASGSKVLSSARQQEEQSLGELEAEIKEALDKPLGTVGDTVKRTLADIPVPFGQMNSLLLVAAYNLWGLDSYAIGRIMNVSADSIDNLLASDICTQLRDDMIDAVRFADTSTVHGFLHQKAVSAAKVVAHELVSKKGEQRLAAAKDILDRSGFRPVDRVEHSMRFEDELKIRYVKDTETPPTINLTPEP